jgi:hypothetical protein
MQTLVITNPTTHTVTIGSTACRVPRGGPTPAQLQQAVTDRFSQLLTTAIPSFEPPTGAFVNLPTLFAANTPQAETFNVILLGQQVTLNVVAMWTWDFGDGGSLTTSNPGGRYPNTSLNHNYRHASNYVVLLTTNWTGTYSLNGNAAIVIPGGPIPRPSAPLPLAVHEAHGVLVTG